MADFCPLLKKTCIKHDCKFYVHLLGQNPQTAKAIDHWDCTFAWLPVLLIENAQQGRQAGAAVESMRNEIVKRMDDHQPMLQLMSTPQSKLIGDNSENNHNPK